MSDLAEKYRPRKFEDFVGQQHAVSGVQDVLKRKSKRVFVLDGPAGTGKTSMARCIATAFGCDPETDPDYMELNVSEQSGIDDVRELLKKLNFVPRNGRRVVVLDEFDGISKQAISALRKPIEEPSKDTIFVLCTNTIAKVPETIRSRGCCYSFGRVRSDVIYDHLKRINKAEKVTKVEGAVRLISQRCNGSVRMALSQLSAIGGLKDLDAVKQVVASTVDPTDKDSPAYKLAQSMVRGIPSWGTLMSLCKPLQDANPEGTRRVIQAYYTTVLLGTTDSSQARRYLAILRAFREPCFEAQGVWPTIVSLGELSGGSRN